MMNNNLYIVLKAVKEANAPIGAIFLSQVLDIPQATIGRILKEAEDKGYLKKIGNKGRYLTASGEVFLSNVEAREGKKQIAEELIDITSSVSSEELLQILTVRRLLEGYAVSLACERATEDEIAGLEELSMEQIVEIKRGRLGNQADLEFHMTIARMSGNEVIFRILKLLLTENNVYTKLAVLSETKKIQQLVRHNDIVEAIKQRDAKGARKAMETHIDRLIASV